ncbi:MAG TPA: hypothetical protein VE779_08180 [Candidatus Angelobacter sp.]|nr:hypothetical protein [Candidatus Angelobacter sp.]
MPRRILSIGALIVAGCTLAWAQDAPSASRPATSEKPTGAKTETAAPNAFAIMQRAVANDIVNWQAAKDYTFLQRTQEDALDGSGSVKSSKSETAEILVLYGEPFERVVAKDDKPLAAGEQKKQDEKFEKETSKRANETPDERQKRLAKYEKEREDERAFVREILGAYDFALVGNETVNGRATWVIDATPRPGFEGKTRESKLLLKIKQRFWIDQKDYSWTKLRAEFTDTVSIGWVVARLHKGTQFEMQQIRVNDELWLPQRIDVKLDARVALLKGVNENLHVTYKDYQRFRAETKISVADPASAPQ